MKYSLILCSDMHMDIDKANSIFLENPHIEWVSDYKIADVVIIMTCAFGTKKRYSMFVIADVIKSAKPKTRIIATGCLAKLNKTELEAIPNLEVKSLEEVLKMLKMEEGSGCKYEVCKIPQNTVIISNGCLKKCSYCVYPLFEGKYTSKPLEAVLSEVKYLYESGEPVIYITGAHETSDYGIDLYGKRSFARLIDEVCTNFPNAKYVIGWFHPVGLTDDVIRVLSKHKNIVQIMVHIQHVENALLSNMNRPKFEETEERIQKLHAVRPDLGISTELIVGFPGETEEMFNHLVEYLEKRRNIFTDIGIASYEPVINTKASKLSNLPRLEVRNARMQVIKEKFGAVGYEAPKDFEPLLSSFFEACYLLDWYADEM